MEEVKNPLSSRSLTRSLERDQQRELPPPTASTDSSTGGCATERPAHGAADPNQPRGPQQNELDIEYFIFEDPGQLGIGITEAPELENGEHVLAITEILSDSPASNFRQHAKLVCGRTLVSVQSQKITGWSWRKLQSSGLMAERPLKLGFKAEDAGLHLLTLAEPSRQSAAGLWSGSLSNARVDTTEDGETLPEVLVHLKRQLQLNGGFEAKGIFLSRPSAFALRAAKKTMDSNHRPPFCEDPYVCAALILDFCAAYPGGILNGLSLNSLESCDTEVAALEALGADNPIAFRI